MSRARVKLPWPLNQITRTELETAIYEAALHTDDGYIAKRYILDKVPLIDVAVEMGWDRGTVAERADWAMTEASRVALRLWPDIPA